MKKTAILLLLLGLVVSCNNGTKSEPDEEQSVPPVTEPAIQPLLGVTAVYDTPKGKRENKKLLTIYLTPDGLDGDSVRPASHFGLRMFDANGDFGTGPNFTSYFFAEKKNNSGVIMWEPARSNNMEIDSITPDLGASSRIFEGSIVGPPYLIVLSKALLDNLVASEDTIHEKYSIHFSVDGKSQTPVDPYIIITPR